MIAHCTFRLALQAVSVCLVTRRPLAFKAWLRFPITEGLLCDGTKVYICLAQNTGGISTGIAVGYRCLRNHPADDLAELPCLQHGASDGYHHRHRWQLYL